MKVLSFECGKPLWSIPVNELSIDIKRMLRMQWREFINQIDDLFESNTADDTGTGDAAVLAMLEKLFAAQQAV